jgi:CHAD domain-containing protein
MNVEFHWLQAQLSGVKDDRDPEFVHQARVATRRMRSAFILLRSAVPAESADYFEKSLQQLGRLFGAVRDLDVFIINLRTYREKLEKFSKRDRRLLKKVIIKERRAPFHALLKALASSSFHTFERRMEQFMTLPEGSAPGSMTMKDAAPQAIKSRLTDVMAQRRKVTANPVLTEYHCLRIKAKRLRYALEFMAPLYGSAFDEIIPRTVEIQDCLGELQDTVFNKGLIKRLLKKWKRKTVDPGLVFTLGEIYQYQGEIAREKEKKFVEIWKRFARRENLAALKAVLEKRQAPKEVRA